MAEQRELSRKDLRTIAVCQKAILICIVVDFLAGYSRFVLLPEPQILFPMGVIGLAILSTGFVLLLATKVSRPVVGVVQGILTLIPLFGLFVLLVINQKATTTLQRHGIHVGLLGARLSDLK